MSDDESEEKEQQPPEAMPVFPDRGPNREGMANEYLPEQDDHSAKTLLNVNDPARVAALRQWGQIFPERAHRQETIDGFLDEFLMARPSVGGDSRDEYKEIIMSMFGGSVDSKAASKAIQMLGIDSGDD